MSSVLGRLTRRSEPVARIAFNMRPVKHAWGGGNWWLTQVVRHLRRCGYEVRFDLTGELDGIVLVDPRVGGNVSFGAGEIAAYKERRRGTRCLHRINECDLRKGTDEIDALLADANAVADHTVFISSWLRDYHADRWFDSARPHTVIHNGADPAVFHPIGSARFEAGTLRVVTHHWSDNPMKGFDVYERVDRLIAAGELADVELWVIGRWPATSDWRAARTFPPATGRELAAQLRRCHVYLTASRFEPGGMHHVEGAQCGLPVLYHEDGGGIGEQAGRYGIAYGDDVQAAIGEARAAYDELRGRVLEHAPSGDRMCADYRAVLQRLL
jgi:glycosyltransferase involved in cell wall biosynthesis